MTYDEFLGSKKKMAVFKSVDIKRDELNKTLFEYQKDLVQLALKKGHFAIFAMTGSGKTAMQGEWAYQVWKKEQKPVLIIAPLAVAHQSVEEIKHILGYNVKYCESVKDVINGINITSYEKLDKFNASEFVAVVLDESSHIKSYTSKGRALIIVSFKSTAYKLACSATPSPNDYTELGNHTEFLNIMSLSEMLSMYFIHDGSNTSNWILKGHAAKPFWEFISTWVAFFTKPSDLGYANAEDDKFKLPKLNMHHIEVEHASTTSLFADVAQTLSERRQAKKDSLDDRCKAVADICNSNDDNYLVWCELNDEGKKLKELINDAVEIKGSDSDEFKAKAMQDFAKGKIRVLITKPKIAGFGMNWQKHCKNVVYASLSDSFEGFFQSLMRVYRYGQKNDVDCCIVTSEAEANVLSNINRKEKDFLKMIDGVISQTKDIVQEEIRQTKTIKTEYNPKVETQIPNFLKVS
ncbi:DEAD/DEAH box helicase [Campylobacter pinnipediorum]|uniref:Helicase n=1 Tax=Campylobacter pinnipediorum subsp. pinnipediorum TaxID=1660067 RepID=A0AAX0L9S3_9BACT|nr:DEAD/DEAH box helicase family protein [Campylobacter pinnipediorum]AQW81251.1 DEAD-like helicase [Campylobacter pinnipediorum subsp. pinnipediorum]AQW82871.1 DEAD-like helicase [Campylobacter pinnipediorum subsp. pinnipediorum]OPA77213.1 helicase [Campylobacter pinnipediorum subsp. pinnipediorum]